MEHFLPIMSLTSPIRYEDHSDLLSSLLFVPTLASHQHSDPSLSCGTRIIGDFELIYYIGGEGQVQIADCIYPVSAGDILLIRPFESHSIQSSQESPHNNYWVHFDIYPDALQQQWIATTFPDSRRKIHIGVREDLIRHYSELLEEMKGKRPGYSGLRRYLFSALVLKITRILTEMHPNTPVYIQSTHRQGLQALQKAEHYLRNQYQQSVTAQDIAEYCSVSPSYLYRLFQQHLKITPGAYLTRIRLKRAEQLLKITDLPISDIAAEVGFSDPFYFSKTFKKVYGVSPSQYIKQIYF